MAGGGCAHACVCRERTAHVLREHTLPPPSLCPSSRAPPSCPAHSPSSSAGQAGLPQRQRLPGPHRPKHRPTSISWKICKPKSRENGWFPSTWLGSLFQGSWCGPCCPRPRGGVHPSSAGSTPQVQSLGCVLSFAAKSRFEGPLGNVAGEEGGWAGTHLRRKAPFLPVHCV